MQRITMKDAFNFALQLEAQGHDFYIECSGNAREEQVQSLFRKLAAEEKKHMERFKKILAGVEKEDTGELTDQRSKMLMDAYAKAFFPGQAETDKKAMKRLSALEAAGFGVRIEQNSIDYYRKLRSLAPESDREAIGLILAEEEKHYEQLTRLQSRLAANT